MSIVSLGQDPHAPSQGVDDDAPVREVDERIVPAASGGGGDHGFVGVERRGRLVEIEVCGGRGLKLVGGDEAKDEAIAELRLPIHIRGRSVEDARLRVAPDVDEPIGARGLEDDELVTSSARHSPVYDQLGGEVVSREKGRVIAWIDHAHPVELGLQHHTPVGETKEDWWAVEQDAFGRIVTVRSLVRAEVVNVRGQRRALVDPNDIAAVEVGVTTADRRGAKIRGGRKDHIRIVAGPRDAVSPDATPAELSRRRWAATVDETISARRRADTIGRDGPDEPVIGGVRSTVGPHVKGADVRRAPSPPVLKKEIPASDVEGNGAPELSAIERRKLPAITIPVRLRGAADDDEFVDTIVLREAREGPGRELRWPKATATSVSDSRARVRVYDAKRRVRDRNGCCVAAVARYVDRGDRVARGGCLQNIEDGRSPESVTTVDWPPPVTS